MTANMAPVVDSGPIWTAFQSACTNAAIAVISVLPTCIFAASVSLVVAVLYRRVVRDISFQRCLGYFLAFSFFGISLGTLTALPEAPDSILAQLLAPFLAIFTGAIAFVTNKEVSEELKKLTPGAMTSFLVNVMFGFNYTNH